MSTFSTALATDVLAPDGLFALGVKTEFNNFLLGKLTVEVGDVSFDDGKEGIQLGIVELLLAEFFGRDWFEFS